jgi:hypothetical protein
VTCREFRANQADAAGADDGEADFFGVFFHLKIQFEIKFKSFTTEFTEKNQIGRHDRSGDQVFRF